MILMVDFRNANAEVSWSLIHLDVFRIKCWVAPNFLQPDNISDPPSVKNTKAA